MTIQKLDRFREQYCAPASHRQETQLRILYRPKESLHFCEATQDISTLLVGMPHESLVLTFPGQYLVHTSDLHLFSLSTTLILAYPWSPDIHTIILLMQREYETTNPEKNNLLKTYLAILLLYVTRHAHPVSQPLPVKTQPGIVHRFVLAVDEAFRSKHYVSDYADLLAVTPNYLNEAVKRTMGESAGNHIRRRVALEAKRMAMYADMSLKEIAYDLGFTDPSYFSRFFRSVIGVTFSDFRRKHTPNPQ